MKLSDSRIMTNSSYHVTKDVMGMGHNVPKGRVIFRGKILRSIDVHYHSQHTLHHYSNICILDFMWQRSSPWFLEALITFTRSYGVSVIMAFDAIYRSRAFKIYGLGYIILDPICWIEYTDRTCLLVVTARCKKLQNIGSNSVSRASEHPVNSYKSNYRKARLL